jgi:hypothetical protein
LNNITYVREDGSRFERGNVYAEKPTRQSEPYTNTQHGELLRRWLGTPPLTTANEEEAMNEDINTSREDHPSLECLEDSMVMLDGCYQDEHGEGGAGSNRDAIASAVQMLDVSADSSTEGDALKVLQSKSQLRKNLDLQEFRRTSVGPNAVAVVAKNRPSFTSVGAAAASSSMNTSSNLRRNSFSSNIAVSDKIAHYESESKRNAQLATSLSSKSPRMIIGGPPLPNAATMATELPPHPRFQVMLRIRPSTDPTSMTSTASTAATDVTSNNCPTTIEIVDSTKVRTHPPPTSYAGVSKEYTFDRVLEPSMTQRQVYELAAAPLVPRIFQGGSALLFCYGVTNAGKTYTVHGDSGRLLKAAGNSSSSSIVEEGGDGSFGVSSILPEPSWGILPRVLHDTLTRVQASASGRELRVSFFEIYQERFYDLLPDSSPTATAMPSNPFLRKSLRLREDRAGIVAVKGLTSHRLDTMAQALRWMKAAKKNRVTCTNSLNQTSSRSHFVCHITVTSSTTSVENEVATTHEHVPSFPPPGSFWIVDLAGSERSKRTLSSRGIISQKEASNINTSNMVLMHCLMSLRDHPSSSHGNGASNGSTNTSHPYKVPPYRNSQLTRLLMPHWSRTSNTATAMIVNVNPAACDYDESQHVLGYASQAKTIQLSLSTKPGKGDASVTTKSTVEYDENGRRIYTGAAPAKVGVRAKVGKLLQKLSPKRVVVQAGGGIKRKQAGDNDIVSFASAKPALSNKRFKTNATSISAASTNAFVSSATEAPPHATAPGTANVKASNVYKKLKMELVVATTEIDVLMGEKRMLEDKVESLEREAESLERQLGNAEMAIRNEVEFAIRNEVVSEVQEKWEAQRKEYESIIATLRQQVPSASAMKRAPALPAPALATKVEELEDELKDRIEEIEELRGDMEVLEREHQREMEVVQKDSERLRLELAKSQEEAKNYKRLLHEEDGFEEESDGDEDQEMTDEDRDSLVMDLGCARSNGPSPNSSVTKTDTGEESGYDDDDDESRRATLVSEPVHPGAASSATHRRSLRSSATDSSTEDDTNDESRRATLVSERVRPVVTVSEGSVGAPPSQFQTLPGSTTGLAMRVHEPVAAKRDDETQAIENAEIDSMIASYFDESEAVRKPDSGYDSVTQGLATSCPLADNMLEKASGEVANSNHGNSFTQENGNSLFSFGMSPNRSAKSTATKFPMPGSNRKPFGPVEENFIEESQEDNGEDEFSEQWLAPKVKAKIDPKTGKYKRPKGRMPSGADSWDADKGQWRLSLA